MFVFRTFMTVVNIIWIMVFFIFSNDKDRNAMVGTLMIELTLICNTILIWS